MQSYFLLVHVPLTLAGQTRSTKKIWSMTDVSGLFLENLFVLVCTANDTTFSLSSRKVKNIHHKRTALSPQKQFSYDSSTSTDNEQHMKTQTKIQLIYTYTQQSLSNVCGLIMYTKRCCCTCMLPPMQYRNSHISFTNYLHHNTLRRNSFVS